jgi:hypothetical protein
MMTRRDSSAALAVATILVAACGGGGKDPMTPVPPQNTAPAVSSIVNQSADQDTRIGPIGFGIADSESDVGTLKIVAAADSSDLFPADGIVLGGTGASRTLTLMPFEAHTGTATISVLVSDPQGAMTTRTFTVTVKARPASMKDVTLSTFAKGASDEPTAVGGFTFSQDADEPATFAVLIPAGDE